MVPVSFETVVTETGMLQLWCVARDGRRWKLEFNVREQVARMKIGIDLGTTNSALAYIDEREAEDRDFPPRPHLRNAATGGRRARGAAPHAAFVSVPRRRPAGRRLRARAGRAGAHAAGALGEIVAVESRRRPHRQDPAVGFAGDRARALAGGGLGALPRQVPRGVGHVPRARRWPSRTSCSRCPRRSTKRRAS